MIFLDIAAVLALAGALVVRFGLRGNVFVGGAIGLILFYGVALPLLAGFEGEHRLKDPPSFFLTMGGFAVASSAFGLLAVAKPRRRKLFLALAATSLPLVFQVFHFTPVVAWGFAVIGFVPAAVFLATASCALIWERLDSDTLRELGKARSP